MNNWSLLGKYIKPYLMPIIAIVIMIVISSFSILSLGQGLRYVIDHDLITQNKGASFFTVLLYTILIIVIMSTAIFGRICLISCTGEKIIADIRVDVYAHLLGLPQRFFENTKMGSILSTLVSDTAVLQIIISSTLSNALRNISMVAGSAIMMLHSSVILSAYSCLAIPTVILIIALIGRKVKKLSKEARDSVANIASYSEETLHGIKTIQAFTCEKNAIRQFTRHVQYTLRCFVKYEFMRAWLVVLVIITVLSTIGFIFWAGNNNVVAGNITYGQLSAFIFYAMLAANSTSRLSELFSEAQQAHAAIQRLDELFAQTNAILIESMSPVPIPETIENLSFSNVAFRHSSQHNAPTLDNLSFTINPGEKIAIVGPSGAGKSTIFDLILRFYDIGSGAITINGINIKEFSLYDLRTLFAIVPQESTIFSTTIANNILYGNLQAGYEEMKAAAKDAHATEFIKKLENKFESPVGEKGRKLSGGEKQRIAIARAILRNAKILLLDEATSSLDTENERLIQDSLNTIASTITITIAHRLSTVTNANKIIVINKGKIEEIGTHDTLLSSNGMYTRLIHLQKIK